MAEKHLCDFVIRLDKYPCIVTGTAVQKISVEHICPGSHTLIIVFIKPRAETIKQTVFNQRFVITVIVADRGNRIQTCQFTRSEVVRDSVSLEVLEVFGPYFACFHPFI